MRTCKTLCPKIHKFTIAHVIPRALLDNFLDTDDYSSAEPSTAARVPALSTTLDARLDTTP